MKIIFFTFALLAVTNAHFLRNLTGETVLSDAKFSTSCTDFASLKITLTLPEAATDAIGATTITLEGNESGETKTTLTIECTAATKGATELVCGGAPKTGTPANGVAYIVKAITDTAFSVGTQKATVTYNSGYLALETNPAQTVDYDDEAKTKFTVTYTKDFVEGATLPEIKVGTEVVTCELDANYKKQLNCAPDKEKIKEQEEAYQITAKNVCGTYDNVAKLTVKDSSAFLKTSLALLIAVFLF